MKITITQFDEGFMADCTDLPGSPPVGHGPTPEAAIIELFFRLMFSKINGPAEDQSWLKYLKYEHGYTMNCPNYRPQFAKKEIPGSSLSLDALVIRAADEIYQKDGDENGNNFMTREELQALLTRYFNQPTVIEVGIATPAADNGSSPKPPDEPPAEPVFLGTSP